MDQNQIMAKPVAKTPEIVVPAELNITMKQVDAVNTAVDFEEISPMEMTIENHCEWADERRKKIKRIQL
jgi:cell division protein FtsZ